MQHFQPNHCDVIFPFCNTGRCTSKTPGTSKTPILHFCLYFFKYQDIETKLWCFYMLNNCALRYKPNIHCWKCNLVKKNYLELKILLKKL